MYNQQRSSQFYTPTPRAGYGYTPTGVTVFSCPAERHDRSEEDAKKIVQPAQALKLMNKHVKKSSSTPVIIACTSKGLLIRPVQPGSTLVKETRATYEEIYQVFLNSANTKLIMLCSPSRDNRDKLVYETFECKTESDIKTLIDYIAQGQDGKLDVNPLTLRQSAYANDRMTMYEEYDREPSPLPDRTMTRATYERSEKPRIQSYYTNYTGSLQRRPEYGYPLREECIFVKQDKDGVTVADKGPIFLYSCRTGNEVQAYEGQDLESGTNSPIWR